MGNDKGTLLFECFVALMILSIGIVGALRIFSEAVYWGSRNASEAKAQAGYSEKFFELNAVPGASKPAGAREEFLVQSKDGDSYKYRVSADPLVVPRESKNEKGNLIAPPVRSYEKVRVKITDPGGRKLKEFESVVLGAKTA